MDGNPIGKYPEDNCSWVLPDYKRQHEVDTKTMWLPGLYLVGVTRTSDSGNARLCQIVSDLISMSPKEALQQKMRLINECFLNPLKARITHKLQFEGVEAFETEVECDGFKATVKAHRIARKERICGVRRCTGKVDVTILGMPWPLPQTITFLVDEVAFHGDMVNNVMPASALAS